jgi:hypothetical protein
MIASVAGSSFGAVSIGFAAARKTRDECRHLHLGLGERRPDRLRRAGRAVDEHSADQIVLPLALVPGASEYRVGRVTRHLTTNVAVIRRFLDRDITVEGDEGRPGVVRVATGFEPG